MMRNNLLLWAIVLAGSTTGLGDLAHAGEPPEIYPLEKVRRGQKGYGLTTMKGTTPERFNFEVIGVNHNALPKMDLILVKSDDPKLAVTGFWAGMSGSPLFIEGKVVCAFSYGYAFNKVAIGGCTPIRHMKKEGYTPRRNTDSATMGRPVNKKINRLNRRGKQKGKQRSARAATANWREWRKLTPSGSLSEAMASVASDASTPWIFKAPLPTTPLLATATDDNGLVAASVPMAMSGFSRSAFRQAKQLMANFPVKPMQAGGTGNANIGPRNFRLGGSIAIQFMRGDMSMAATGTVSYVEKNRVLAFGHPMFQSGEIYAPVATAEVHTVIPSARKAFVIASPLREIGSLVQDRQSTIMADTGLRSDMIPLQITIRSHGARGQQTAQVDTFEVELLNNRFFTPILAGIAASNAASHFYPDQDHVTAKMTSTVTVRGYPPLSFTDYAYSETGTGGLIGEARGLRALIPLLHNPFSPIEIEKIEFDVDISFDHNYGEIEAIRLPTAELLPGESSYVDVTFRRYDDKRIVERVPFDVPAQLAGSLVRLAVSSGDVAQVDAAPPQSVAGLITLFRNLLPGNVIAVTLYSAEEGVALRGKLVRDLPASALDKFHTATRTQATSTYKPMARTIQPSKRVISGIKSLMIKVGNKKRH